MPVPSTTRRLLALLVTAGMLGTTCARKGLPPGGPQDDTPPFVVATSPDSGAVSVPLGAPLEIEFSENMNKPSVLDWVLLSPPRDFTERGWKGTRFHLASGDDFLPQTTYTIIVGTGCRDAREGIPMTAPHTFVFSTGDSIDQGRIEGRLLARNQTAHGTMVWAFDLEMAATRPDTMLPDYLAQAAADSSYVLLGLRPGRRYLVAAHADANRDREFDRHTEFLAFYPETLLVAAETPFVRGIDIDYRDPRAPGTIAGAVIDSTRAALAAPDSIPTARAGDDTLRVVDTPPDTTRTATTGDEPTRAPPVAGAKGTADTDVISPATVLAAIARPDSARQFLVQAWPWTAQDSVWGIDSAAVEMAPADTLGHYEFRQLDPGYWRLEAWLDRNGNQSYDAGEPVSAPADSVRVLPLERTDVDLIVREE